MFLSAVFLVCEENLVIVDQISHKISCRWERRKNHVTNYLLVCWVILNWVFTAALEQKLCILSAVFLLSERGFLSLSTILFIRLVAHHTSCISFWISKSQAISTLKGVISSYNWLVEADISISSHFLWKEMEIIQIYSLLST